MKLIIIKPKKKLIRKLGLYLDIKIWPYPTNDKNDKVDIKKKIIVSNISIIQLLPWNFFQKNN